MGRGRGIRPCVANEKTGMVVLTAIAATTNALRWVGEDDAHPPSGGEVAALSGGMVSRPVWVHDMGSSGSPRILSGSRHQQRALAGSQREDGLLPAEAIPAGQHQRDASSAAALQSWDPFSPVALGITAIVKDAIQAQMAEKPGAAISGAGTVAGDDFLHAARHERAGGSSN